MSRKLISSPTAFSLVFGVVIAGTLGVSGSSAAPTLTTSHVVMGPAQACYVPRPTALRVLPLRGPSTFFEQAKFFAEAGL